MLKNITQLEAIINEKSIKLLADMDTDINIVRAALDQFQKYIDLIEEAAKKPQEQVKQFEEVIEDVKEAV